MKKQKGYIGLLRLLITIACLWFFFHIVSPMLVNSIPALKHYGEVQDFYDVHSGRMYYTDLKTSQMTEMYINNALKYSSSVPQDKPNTPKQTPNTTK